MDGCVPKVKPVWSYEIMDDITFKGEGKEPWPESCNQCLKMILVCCCCRRKGPCPSLETTKKNGSKNKGKIQLSQCCTEEQVTVNKFQFLWYK